jgi:hypothetical protein
MTLKDRKTAPFGNFRSTIPAEAAFSPDGRWVVYQTREPGSSPSTQAFVQPFPSTGSKYLVPQNGGHPFWSRKGTELFLNTGPTQSAVIAVTTAPRFGFGQPVEYSRLGRSEPNPNTGRRNVDVLPDGEHFLGVISTGAGVNIATSITPQVAVVLNWFEEVKQRAPRK